MSHVIVAWSIACSVAMTSSAAVAGRQHHESDDQNEEPGNRHDNKKRFDFAVIGDTGYGAQEADYVNGLISELSAAKLEFVMHVGDFKAPVAAQPCTDAFYLAVRNQFNLLTHPFIYTPGDNEWIDCPVSGPPGSIAEERLAALRRIFFPGVDGDPLYSLGQRPMRLESQSADAAHATFRENTRWELGEIMFLTVNVPDTDNQGTTRCLQYDASNTCVRTGIDDTEWAARTSANVDWINQAFDEAIAEDMKGIVVGTQVNFIGGFTPTRYSPTSPRYKAVLAAIKAGAKRFGGQVLLVHGDTHTPRIDQPYNGIQSPEVAPGVFAGLPLADVRENLTRIEVYGSTAASRAGVSPQQWFRVSVDPSTRRVFTIVPGELERRDRDGDDDE